MKLYWPSSLEMHTLLSADSVQTQDGAVNYHQPYPTEYLNSLRASGLPLSKLTLKPGLVFKSPVRSGFFPFLEETATATGFLKLKNSATATGTIKDRSVPVSFGSTTGLNWFSLNRTLTGLSRSEPFFFSFLC